MYYNRGISGSEVWKKGLLVMTGRQLLPQWLSLLKFDNALAAVYKANYLDRVADFSDIALFFINLRNLKENSSNKKKKNILFNDFEI